MTRSHHETAGSVDIVSSNASNQIANSTVSAGALINRRSNFLTTSRIIRLFSAGVKVHSNFALGRSGTFYTNMLLFNSLMQVPSKGAKVVYLAGSWDMFHAGHASVLEKARE